MRSRHSDLVPLFTGHRADAGWAAWAWQGIEKPGMCSVWGQKYLFQSCPFGEESVGEEMNWRMELRYHLAGGPTWAEPSRPASGNGHWAHKKAIALPGCLFTDLVWRVSTAHGNQWELPATETQRNPRILREKEKSIARLPQRKQRDWDHAKKQEAVSEKSVWMRKKRSLFGKPGLCCQVGLLALWSGSRRVDSQHLLHILTKLF